MSTTHRQVHTASGNPGAPLTRSRRGLRGFTLVELIIVMMIIVMLLAILLPALGSARRRAKVTAAKKQLANIVTACESYTLAFNAPPGPSPDASIGKYSGPPAGYGQVWPGTMDLVAGLLGGVSTGTIYEGGPFNGSSNTAQYPLGAFTFDPAKVGVGPAAVSGGAIVKTYGAFYSPKPGELKTVTVGDGAYDAANLPHIIDVHFEGMPIAYFRANTAATTLAAWDSVTVAQYYVTANSRFFASTGVSSGGKTIAQANDTLLHVTAAGSSATAGTNLGKIAANLSISAAADVPRGRFLLMNAGDDGVYFKKSQTGRINIGNASIVDANDLNSFDDLTAAGG